MDGVAPAVGNAILDAVGVNLDSNPVTPERLWRALREQGRALERDLDRYHIFRADEMPELTTIFVETFEPSHPFGVKAVAEIPMDGVAPAVGNAVLDAVGANIDSNPVTPEKLWRAMRGHSTDERR